MVNVIEQFKATTGDYVVISAINGFIPDVLMCQTVTTLGYPIALKGGYAHTVKDLQVDNSNNKVLLMAK